MNNEGVAVLLTPGYSGFDLAAIVDCFRLAHQLTKRPSFYVDFYSAAGGQAISAGGILQVNGAPFSAAWPHRLLMVLLGQDSRSLPEESVRAQICAWLSSGSRVVLVGELSVASRFWGGSIILRPFLKTTLQTQSAKEGETGFVDYLPSGITVLDGVLAHIGEQHSIELMLHVSSSLLQRDRRSLGQVSGFERALRKALPWAGPLLDEVAQNEGPPRKLKLADAMGVSGRQLERTCKRWLQMTPMQFVRLMRLHRAHESVLYSDLPVAEIARQAGFLSQSHFSKSYREQFGRPPTVARRLIHTSSL